MAELSNGLMSIAIDDDTGSVTQIVDIGTGRNFLEDPTGARLFKLVVPTEWEMSRAVYSHLSPRPRIDRFDDRLVLSFDEISAGDEVTNIRAEVIIRLPQGSREALFSIKVVNGGARQIHEVHFPWIGGWTGIGGPGVDTVTVGESEMDPHAVPSVRCHTFGGYNRRRFFPRGANFMDISGGGAGLSYCVYIDRPRIFGIVVDNLSPNYETTNLSWSYVGRPYIQPGAVWESPVIGVGVHRGDWHETADRYRAFLDTWWTAPPSPARLRDSIGFFNVQLLGFNGERYHDAEDIVAIARDCLQYGVEDLCLWDMFAQVYIRPDTGVHWEMPPERTAAMRRALEEARRLGCITSTCVNYRLITEYTRLFPELESELVRTLYGQPRHEFWSVTLKHGPFWNRDHDQGGRLLCQSSPKFRQFALDLTRRTLDLGFTSLFIDQATEWNLCFDAKHGHAAPDDTIVAANAWMAEAAELVRGRDPEAYVIGEVPVFDNTAVLDQWWEWYKRRHTREVLRYVIPGSMQMWCIDENELDVIARAFASGHQLGLMTRQLGGMLGDEPRLAAQVARLAKLRKATAPFLARGTFRDNRGLDYSGGYAYSYVSDAGLAVGLANPEKTAQTIKVALQPEVLGSERVDEGRVHHENGEIIPVVAARRDGALEVEVTLPPRGAAVWCLPTM